MSPVSHLSVYLAESTKEDFGLMLYDLRDDV
jgi:hypothetical protein